MRARVKCGGEGANSVNERAAAGWVFGHWRLERCESRHARRGARFRSRGTLSALPGSRAVHWWRRFLNSACRRCCAPCIASAGMSAAADTTAPASTAGQVIKCKAAIMWETKVVRVGAGTGALRGRRRLAASGCLRADLSSLRLHGNTQPSSHRRPPPHCSRCRSRRWRSRPPRLARSASASSPRPSATRTSTTTAASTRRPT